MPRELARVAGGAQPPPAIGGEPQTTSVHHRAVEVRHCVAGATDVDTVVRRGSMTACCSVSWSAATSANVAV